MLKRAAVDAMRRAGINPTTVKCHIEAGRKAWWSSIDRAADREALMVNIGGTPEYLTTTTPSARPRYDILP